jgi:hypothetical protein
VCLAFSFFNMRAVQCASAACIIRFFFFVQFPRALVVMLFTSCWLAFFCLACRFLFALYPSFLPLTLNGNCRNVIGQLPVPTGEAPAEWVVLTPRNLKFSRRIFLNFLSGHVREWELE